ncbi:MATE family efflux transporter [Shewanella inventionis]|uniref:MATE family efflux transporter n=1 Tax=Shewanella inventionis TaxID=1738770 RepID=A0ABQ1IZJ5_9GAMM|nr:MATE family efflux transporter [Shewanella inventionis]MCL1158474.1 MATE family efflux transporter [Shewanella inventionis]UAL42986.1 MATE family efflux transporter [Shewanella inventionis]GGB56475.1 MATE family efflux transporter [Shewanella inventionis]
MHSNSDKPLSLFSLTWPLFVDFALHFLTAAINTFMISHVSYQGVAALSVGNMVFELAITLFSFVSIGASVVITQYLGSQNKSAASSVVYSSIGFNFLVGLVAATGILTGSTLILNLMNLPAELMADGKLYLQIVGLCLIPEAMAMCLAAGMRAHGFTQQAMWVTLSMNVITFVGNLLLLYGWFGIPQMGVAGIAISTVAGRLVGMTIMAILFVRYTGIKIHIPSIVRPELKMLKKVFHIGLPAAGENVSWMLQFMVVTSFVGLMGDKALAAQSLYFQICMFILLFGLSIGIGNEIIIGHMVGAKKLKAAEHQMYRALKLGLIVTTVVALFVAIWGPNLVGLFTDEKDIALLVGQLFILTLVMEPGRTFNLVVINALRASGDAKFPFFMGLFSMWCIAVPGAYLLGIHFEFGLLGVWAALALDEWVRGLAMLWRWRSGRWQTKSLIA